MKTTWLIERGVYPEAAAFVAEVERQGIACYEVDYRPGKPAPHDILGCPPLAEESCVVLWGTLPLMQQIQLHRKWVPGGWCNLEALDCAAYYPHFRDYLLNREHWILPGVEALQRRDELYERFGPVGEVFVRPSGVHKLFSGRAVYVDDFETALAPVRYFRSTRVVVAAPQEIGREWRLVIVDDAVVVASQYRDAGAIVFSAGCPDEVTQFGTQILRDVRWRPDRAFVLDVGETPAGLRLVELNSFSCSGLYACDFAAVIAAASRAAEDEWQRRKT